MAVDHHMPSGTGAGAPMKPPHQTQFNGHRPYYNDQPDRFPSASASMYGSKTKPDDGGMSTVLDERKLRESKQTDDLLTSESR